MIWYLKVREIGAGSDGRSSAARPPSRDSGAVSTAAAVAAAASLPDSTCISIDWRELDGEVFVRLVVSHGLRK